MTHPVVAAHERRLAELDPLLPATHPLPEPRPADALLTVAGGAGLARREQVDLNTLEASWGAADQHRLLARVAGPDPVAAMAELLSGWQARVAGQASDADPDSQAILLWPSRDTAMTSLFLAYGLAPLTVTAARPAGRAGPDGDAVRVRPIEPAASTGRWRSGWR